MALPQRVRVGSPGETHMRTVWEPWRVSRRSLAAGGRTSPHLEAAGKLLSLGPAPPTKAGPPVSPLVHTFREDYRFPKDTLGALGASPLKVWGNLDCTPNAIIHTSEGKADPGKCNLD